jgi:hypothetical protein
MAVYFLSAACSSKITVTVKAGNFVTVKTLGAPGRLSLTAIDFAQKPKVKGLIFYFFYIL